MDPVWKQAGEQESSDPLLANASQPIRVGSGMFTGYIDIYKPPRKETIRSEKSPTENVQQNHKEKQHSKRKFLCELDIEHSDRIFSQDSQAYDDLPSN